MTNCSCGGSCSGRCGHESRGWDCDLWYGSGRQLCLVATALREHSRGDYEMRDDRGGSTHYDSGVVPPLTYNSANAALLAIVRQIMAGGAGFGPALEEAKRARPDLVKVIGAGTAASDYTLAEGQPATDTTAQHQLLEATERLMRKQRIGFTEALDHVRRVEPRLIDAAAHELR
jgi:hypothetical protein